jgi:hypothetical protein
MDVNERLARSLKQLAQQTEVPPEDPGRLGALLEAFDAEQHHGPRAPGRDYRWIAMLATAAALVVATAAGWAVIGRHDLSSLRAGSHTRASLPHDVQPPPAGGFIVVPGATLLPPLESGSLVRMELPVSILPSLGMSPPATGHGTQVTADVIVGQDGLPRAVRLVE